MRHRLKIRTKVLLITLAVIAAGFAYLFFRIRTGLNSAIQVQKLKDGLYYMEYNGDYGFDRFLEQGGADSDLEVARFVGKDLLGGLVIPGFKTGKFGCSTLTARNEKGGVMYGRNFDWMECTAMVIKSKPANGYASVSTVNLDFLDLGTEYDPDKILSRVISAASLYAPMDGINEEGLCVAVLMIDDRSLMCSSSRMLLHSWLRLRKFPAG